MNDDRLDVEGLQEDMKEVVKVHGRLMFEFVMHLGMSREAAGRLAQATENTRLMEHVVRLSEGFNQIATMLVKRQEWTPEMLGECEQAILRVASKRIVVPKLHIVH